MLNFFRKKPNPEPKEKTGGSDSNQGPATNDVPLVLLGSSGAGKSCLLERFVSGTFISQPSTVGCSYRLKEVEILGQHMKLKFFDTMGQERGRSLIPMYCRGVAGCLIFYDITLYPSFEELPFWLAQTRQFAPKDIPIMLVGCKADLSEHRRVPHRKVLQFAQDNGLMYCESSATTGERAADPFMRLATAVLQSRMPEITVIPAQIDPATPISGPIHAPPPPPLQTVDLPMQGGMHLPKEGLTNSDSPRLSPSHAEKLLGAFPELLDSSASDRALLDSALEVAAEACVLKFAKRLITASRARVRELEDSEECNLLSDVPSRSTGEEAAQRAGELSSALDHLELLLRQSMLETAESVGDLESTFALRDEARRDVVPSYNWVVTLASQLKAVLGSGRGFDTDDAQSELGPSPREVYSRIEGGKLVNLLSCLAPVTAFVDEVAAALRSDCDTPPKVSIGLKDEYAAVLALQEAIAQASTDNIRAEYEQELEAAAKEDAALLDQARATLSETLAAVQNPSLLGEVRRIGEINERFPFNPDSEPPRVVGRRQLNDIVAGYVKQIKKLRHEINQASNNCQAYAEDEPELAEANRVKLEEYEVKLRDITQQFTGIYDTQVTFIREAFPELEAFIKEQIDPYCGRGAFRWDVALPDFDLTPIHGDNVLKAMTKPASQKLKELEPVYILKRFSEKAMLHQELAAMRNAKVAGKHHENVAEVKFAFEQKELAATMYYLGMPYYCCDSSVWFVARIQSKESGALLQAMIAMVRGLGCLHNNGIVHGDVKPDNLRFDAEGPVGVPKWIDFNFCANRSSTLKVWGMKTMLAVGNSVGFSSPEQVEHGILTPASDIFALGKTFAALLFVAGHSPWEKTTNQTPIWRAQEVVDLFGSDNMKKIVNMIEEMTCADEARRIPIMDERGADSKSVLSHLENLRQNIKW
jgi:small GTP-binding protein